MRFSEFEGDWERYIVSDLLEFFSTNSLAWDQLEYEQTGIKNLHYGLIHKGLPIIVDTSFNKLPTIKTDSLPKNYTLCINGDIAFADASEDTNDVAKAIEFVNCNDSKVICGLHTIHGRDKLGITELGFKGYAFLSPVFHNQIRRIAQGTKVYSISQKNFHECYLGVPSKIEQQKISTLLSLIDERIATQNKIIEQLESSIKGIYQFLLGDSRTSVSLAQMCDIKKGQQVNKSELSGFGKYYVMNGGVTPSGFFDNYNTNANTISISEGGNSCGYVQYNNVPFWSGGHCYTLENIEDIIDIKYLFHYLKANESQLMTLRIGSGLPNIQKKDLAHFRIPVTEIASQVEISGALDKLTTKVEVEKNIAQAYHTQKQYLLNNLFI